MWKKCFAAMLICLTLLPWCHALEGMDVSVFQGNIDFAAARSDGIEAVYIRAGYGRDGVDAFSAKMPVPLPGPGCTLAFTTFWRPLTPRPPGPRPGTSPP